MTRKILEQTDLRRRDVVGGAAATAAAVQLGIFNSAVAQTAKTLPPITPGAHTSFAPLKQIDAKVLNVAYAEADQPVAHQSSFSTDGLTTFTALSMLRLHWRRRVTA
jgi:hypothetical protein